MTGNRSTPRRFVVAAWIGLFGAIAAVVAFGLAYPEPVSSAALGPEWQCSRLALVWTSCTRLKHAEGRPVRLIREPVYLQMRA